MKRVLNFLFRISLAILSWIGALYSLSLLKDTDVIMGIFFVVIMLCCFGLGGAFMVSALNTSKEYDEKTDITKGGYIIVGKKNTRRKR